MPTTKPRYTFTDTGELEERLDLAQRAWPDVGDRKDLLLRLTRAGEESIRAEIGAREAAGRRAGQRAALERGARLVDVDALLGDAAWR
jgi:hypothetical protein